MTWLWIWVTIGAALSQTVRSTYQKKLKTPLGDLGASYVRFSYALPFAWMWVFIYGSWAGEPLPALNIPFLLWTTVAGVTQIIFTVLLVTLFSHRSFAAGTAFSKTEVIQAALFEALILGHVVSFQVGLAIFIGVVAVFLLSLAKSSLTLRNLLASLLTRQTAIGLGSGAFLGFCTVAYKAASDSLESDNLVTRASMTAGVAVLIQAVLMGLWMWRRAPDQLKASFVHWRDSSIVGLSGAISTACWFTAFSLYAVAPVRAVGQIELLLALAISFFYFRERPSGRELFAMLLLAVSIIMVLLG
ncbi:EamA family transporter [Alphaproteobacteria bacterium LSUCC0719]